LNLLEQKTDIAEVMFYITKIYQAKKYYSKSRHSFIYDQWQSYGSFCALTVQVISQSVDVIIKLSQFTMSQSLNLQWFIGNNRCISKTFGSS